MGLWRAVRVRRAVIPSIAVLLTVALAGCASRVIVEPPSQAAPRIDIETQLPTDVVLVEPSRGDPVRGLQSGRGSVRITTSRLDGGEIGTVPGPQGSRAFSFPRYVAAGTYPRAVLTVRNTSSRDELNPGNADFSWGASFTIDRTSEGRSDDNGNNLVQRGLFSQPTYFKAELDRDHASCEIRGAAGLLLVHSSYVVPAGTWHRMECDRYGDYLRVRVWDLRSGLLVSQAATSGPIGTLSTPSPHAGVPLSIGGKVQPDGSVLADASDQFNGDIAAPFLRIDGLTATER